MITVYGGGHSAYVRICEFHTNVVEIKEDDKYVLQKDVAVEDSLGFTDREFMNVQEILEFADTVKSKMSKICLISRSPVTSIFLRKACAAIMALISAKCF